MNVEMMLFYAAWLVWICQTPKTKCIAISDAIGLLPHFALPTFRVLDRAPHASLVPFVSPRQQSFCANCLRHYTAPETRNTHSSHRSWCTQYQSPVAVQRPLKLPPLRYYRTLTNPSKWTTNSGMEHVQRRARCVTCCSVGTKRPPARHGLSSRLNRPLKREKVLKEVSAQSQPRKATYKRG